MLTEPLARSLEHSGVQYLVLAGRALLTRVGPQREKTPRRNLPVISDNDESEFACGET
jgi:hypothetical protein